ncbi:MAG TPA: protoglobin domain-containing protein [Candidatus Dormibacteraeota bacterium]|nr:protoglobin domain-containing protein [Candidatus Dormibacteraeota bacterium]
MAKQKPAPVGSGTGSFIGRIGLTPEEIAHRKAYLELGPEDESRIMAINELAKDYASPVIEAFYRHLLSFEQTRAFFEDPKVLERVKRLQVSYFLRLTQGDYGAEYVEERLRIGAVHERIGLEINHYLGSYNLYLREVADRLLIGFAGDPGKAMEIIKSLIKLVFLDIGLAIDTYIFQREQTIGQQQESIREFERERAAVVQQEAIRKLSTPVLQVRERMLILPIIGEIDSERARQLTEELLHAIRNTRAKAVVIDITGVPAVDSAIANHLVQTVDAARLMGATAIVTGLSAEVAQTLVSLGVGIDKLNTVGDLQGGIEMADRLLGYRTIPLEETAAEASARE